MGPMTGTREKGDGPKKGTREEGDAKKQAGRKKNKVWATELAS